MSAYYRKLALGAAAFTALFFVARRGYLGTQAQSYATSASTADIITGVPL